MQEFVWLQPIGRRLLARYDLVAERRENWVLGAEARPNWQEQPAREDPDRGAVAMTKPNSGEQRRALGMLAGSPDGCTKSVLLAHGLKDETLTGLVDNGLAKSTPGTVRVGRSQRAIKVTWLTITDEGRKALADT